MNEPVRKRTIGDGLKMQWRRGDGGAGWQPFVGINQMYEGVMADQDAVRRLEAGQVVEVRVGTMRNEVRCVPTEQETPGYPFHGLSEIAQRVNQISDPIARSRRYADSIKVFAAGDATFVLGEWQAWRKACLEAGEVLPPADFKGKA